MMYCHNCGAQVAGSEDKYCMACGARQHGSAPAADSLVSPPVPGPAATAGEGFFGGLRARARVTGEVQPDPVPVERPPVKEADEHPLIPPPPADRPLLPLDELRTRQASAEGGRPPIRPVQSRPLPVEEQRQRLTEEEEKRNARHLEQARRSTPVRVDPPRPRLREAKGWVPWPETIQEKELESPTERLNRMVPGALHQKGLEAGSEKAVRKPPVADRHPDGTTEPRAPIPPAPLARAAIVQPSPAPAVPAVPEEDPIIPWVTPLPISTPEPVKKVPLYEVPQHPPAPPRHPSRPKKGRSRMSGLFEGDGRGIKPSWILAIAGLIVLTLVVFTIFPVQDPAGDQGRHMKINPLTGDIVNFTPSQTTAAGAGNTDVRVTINYKGAWSGKIISSGSIYREIPINGVGTKEISVNQQTGIVSVQAQKKDDSRESLIVRITRGTTILKEGSTVDPSGSLTVSTSLN